MLPLVSSPPFCRKGTEEKAVPHLPPSVREPLRALAPLLCLVFFLALAFLHLSASQGEAASASSPPHSGLEGGMGRAYGPDIEARKAGKNTPQTSVPFDAYGNPITGEVEDAPKRADRPRPGAYGGYGKARGSTPRPLPEPKAKPQWTFK